MAQHRGGGTGTEHVGVIDVGGAGDHRVDQRQHLAARAGTTDRPTRRTVESINAFQPEPPGQRRDEQQAGVGDQVRLIEDDINAIETMRYSSHWKCLLGWSATAT